VPYKHSCIFSLNCPELINKSSFYLPNTSSLVSVVLNNTNTCIYTNILHNILIFFIVGEKMCTLTLSYSQ